MTRQEKSMQQLQGFKRMVAELAWRYWRMLPRQHQIWISVSDLLDDGMFAAYQMLSGGWYDSAKSGISTSIYHVVRNHLFNEYIVRYGNEARFATLESAGILPKKKRFKPGDLKGLTPAGLVSIEAIQRLQNKEYLDHTEIDNLYGVQIGDIPKLSTSESTIEDNVLTDCFVVPALGKIYKEGSSNLQEQMITWFLQNKQKINVKGYRFRIATKEFRGLAKENDLTYFDCEHLVHSQKCMDQLSRELVGITYDYFVPRP